MELRWLETFAMVSRQGGLSAAAEEMGYARSTVTGHIQSLERSLGAHLVDRRSPGQPLTAAGAALIDHAESILAQVDRARTMIARAGEDRDHALVLGATSSVCVYRLPGFLRLFGRLAPEVRFEVETDSARALFDRVEGGSLDVALVNGLAEKAEPPRAGARGVLRRTLWEEDVVMVGVRESVAYPQKVLLTEPGCVYRELTEQDFLGRMPEVDVLQVGTLEGVKSAVLAGLGIGLLPVVAVKSLLLHGRLLQLPIRSRRKVITDVIWNPSTCSSGLQGQLQRLQTVSEPDPTGSAAGTPAASRRAVLTGTSAGLAAVG